jgi:hypothetical protein
MRRHVEAAAWWVVAWVVLGYLWASERWKERRR